LNRIDNGGLRNEGAEIVIRLIHAMQRTKMHAREESLGKHALHPSQTPIEMFFFFF